MMQLFVYVLFMIVPMYGSVAVGSLPETSNKVVAARPNAAAPKPPKISPKELIEAIKNEDKKLLRRQLKAYPELIDAVDGKGNNLLMIAMDSEFDDSNFVLDLLGKTNDLEHRNKEGETAIFAASRYPYSEVLEAVLKRGAKIDVKDYTGQTPLAAALEAEEPSEDNIKLLLAAGVPLEVKPFFGTDANYPQWLLEKIAQKTGEDLAVNKPAMAEQRLTVQDIPLAWQEKLRKYDPKVERLLAAEEKFAYEEKLEKSDATSGFHPVADQAVFIYVDHTEKPGRAPVSNELAKALYQRGMIIIATTYSLLNAIQAFENPSVVTTVWDIRLADPSGQFVVLFPKSKADAKERKQLTSDALSSHELALGIKRDHMRRVTLVELAKTYQEYGENDLLDGSLAPTLPEIFVTKKDYAQYKKTSRMPRFAFYLIGHGLPKTAFAGLSLDHFQQMLNFFETQIKTAFFAYTSCFALGTNSQMVFSDVRAELSGNTYSFPIATHGKIDETIEKFPKINDTTYKTAVSLLTQKETLDLSKLLSALFDDISPQQPAFIRFPWVSWFVPFDGKTASISIGMPFVMGRTEPLRVAGQALLLYTFVIPFELQFVSDKFPYFLSMLPGSVAHYFSSIDIGSHDIYEFIQHMHKEAPKRHVVFVIKRLHARKPQHGIFEGTQTIENVIFDTVVTMEAGRRKITTYVFLKKDGAPYTIAARGLVPMSDYEPRYRGLLQVLEQDLQRVAAKGKQAQDIVRALAQRREKSERALNLPVAQPKDTQRAIDVKLQANQ